MLFRNVFTITRIAVIGLGLCAACITANTTEYTSVNAVALTSQDTLETTPTSIEIITNVPTVSATPPPSETPPSPTATATPVPLAPGAIGPVNFAADVNPLTGLVVEDPTVLERRPLVVKISNAPPLVRPQAGIGEADLVFEHYAEGGVTRFSAIFYTHAPTRVGSIRSARLIDYELVPMYQGMLAFSGASLGVDKRIYGSEYVQDVLCGSKAEGQAKTTCEAEADAVAPPGFIPSSEFADRAYKGVYYGHPYYWRDESIPIPHNMFTNPAALWELAAEEGKNQRPALTGMIFHPDPTENDSALVNPAPVLDIRYRATRVRWEYDPEIGQYRRFADGLPHLDANTDEQVTADNVVVLYAGHYLTDIIESVWQGSVSYSEQITVWPEGDVTLLRDGQRYDGRWIRAVRGDLISFQINDGAHLYLKPGNTFVQLVRFPEQMNPAEEWVKFE
jgi:hypothetical protein